MKRQQNETQVNTPHTGLDNKPQIESVYPYEDEKGELQFEVVRYKPKGFSQRRPDGKGGYINNMQGVRRILYKLPELRATPLTEPVFICRRRKRC